LDDTVCDSNEGCDDGDYCTLDTCEGRSCVHVSTECGGELLCDPASGECVECLTDAACLLGWVCTGGVCVEEASPDAGDAGPKPPLPAPTLLLDLGGEVTLQVELIQAGWFMMGSDAGYADGQPVHMVTISEDFYIGRYEVTQGQWLAVMGTSPSYFSGSSDLPVEWVSWEDAVEFCDTASAATGYTVRLPTEAEWEYACRAGTATEYYFGDDENNLGDYAWYQANSDNRTHEVGGKLPNDWDLYDMHGNVWEWCSDWYGSTYYAVAPAIDPAGPASGTYRVLRGGSWGRSSGLESAVRGRGGTQVRYNGLGFRVVLEP
jgi:formylglycine-generating enzyme required for sulfatase activity